MYIIIYTYIYTQLCTHTQNDNIFTHSHHTYKDSIHTDKCSHMSFRIYLHTCAQTLITKTYMLTNFHVYIFLYPSPQDICTNTITYKYIIILMYTCLLSHTHIFIPSHICTFSISYTHTYICSHTHKLNIHTNTHIDLQTYSI